MITSRASFAGLTLAMTLGISPVAIAADYLRGSYSGHQEPKSTAIDWSGVYAGVLAGFSSVKTDYTTLGNTVGNSVLPNLAITSQIPALIHLGQVRKQGVNYGAFVGANFLWDDVVLGFEVDYNRSSIKAQSQSGPISRALTSATTGTDIWNTTVAATGRSTLNDWGTLRMRAGWAAGYIMPFMTAGLALGNITSLATATGTTQQFAVTADPVTGLPVLTARGPAVTSTAQSKHRGISYGGAIGAGVDMAFFSNFFVRAEWQYIQFASGGSRPELAINTARLAGALKF